MNELSVERINVKPYTNLRFSQYQKIGFIVNNPSKLNKYNFESDTSFNENYDLYYISNNEYDLIKKDFLSETFLLDMVIIYDGFDNLNLLNLLISKCKLLGVPILFIIDDINEFNYYYENYKNCIEIIAQNSDKIISIDTNISEYLNDTYKINIIDGNNVSKNLLNILNTHKRNKNTPLFNIFKSFIASKEKENTISFKKFIIKKSHEIILNSNIFNETWYLSEYPDVKYLNISPINHYLNLGVLEGCNPSPYFNTRNYLENHNIGINPLVHYILYRNSNVNFPTYTYEKNELNIQRYNNKSIIYNELSRVRFEETDPIIDFEDLLAKSYISPYISSPFSFEHKRCFSFMDHLAKYLRKNLKKSDFNPLVSIIIPVYNGISIIKNAINSALNQTYKNIELIIIDDGSIDGTFELLENLDNDKITILKNDINKGVSNARNQGLMHANGEYIAYLDADNLWDSKYIESMIGAFLELQDADALYSGQLLYERYEENPIGMRFTTFNKALLENNPYIDFNSLCHKREIFEKIGGFNEKLTCLEDWEYILKINNEFKIYSIPILLSKYYLNNTSNRLSDNDNIPITIDFLFKIKSQKDSKLIEPNKKVSIIIPSYEALDDLKECLESIFSLNYLNMIEIIVVDNDSNINVKNYLKSLESKENFKLILNDANYGFSYAINQGIAISDSDSDIVLLNNDAILTENAIGHMQKYSYELEDCGIIVPQQIWSYDKIHDVKSHVPYANNSLECDVTPSIAHKNICNVPLFHYGDVLELNFAPFFCVYIKREVINNSLGLDAELGRHYRSDRIFCNYVKYILNKKIYHISKSKVFHKIQKATFDLKKNENDFNYIYSKNQWESELANKLGYKNASWDV